MAYRRRQGVTRSSTFKDDIRRSSPDDVDEASVSSPTLAAKAIRASAAHRESSLSSAYSQSTYRDRSKGAPVYDYTSMKSVNESGGFWGVLARKAKAILEDETMSRQCEDPSISTSNSNKHFQSLQHTESPIKLENPSLRKGLDALTSSLNHIGNALEEGRSIVENKTADIIQETRKLQIRRKGTMSSEQNQIFGVHTPRKQTQATPLQLQTSNEDQLQASRNVAMATAAKAKLLLRELKTLKADLAFAKERCSQLEDENRTLREAGQKGDNPADDDMIRVQLETLLAEKARLANENAEYARENRFLREIVEYHQLTMQDVVYLDDDIEEVTEVYPYPAVSRILSASPPSPSSPPHSLHETSPSRSSSFAKEILPVAVPPQETKVISQTEVPVSSNKGPGVQEDSTDPC